MKNYGFKQKLKDFFDSLTEEKNTFAVPLSSTLQSKLLVTKEKEGKIIGIAGIQRGNLFFVVVKSEYQNQKIGQQLTKKLIKQAIEGNYSYIILNVLQSNVKAVHVFQKMGFEILHCFLSDGKRYYFMILLLKRRGTIWRNALLLAKKTKNLPPFAKILSRL